jgi:phosphoribosylglycinamide formyltransferase-1
MHVIGVMSSGFARRLEHIDTAIKKGELPGARIGVVICNRVETPVLEMAQRLSIPHYVIGKGGKDIDSEARDILLEHGVELVLLTGYYKKVKKTLLDTFPDRILNMHPGPIPQFGGKGMCGIIVQEAVIAAKAQYTGPVVHIVDEEYDHGTVLSFCPIKVRADDTAQTLHERSLQAGGPLLIQVVRDFLYRLDHPKDF